MKALVTGASSGIGRDIARELHKRGITLILHGRDNARLEELRQELGGGTQVITADLSDMQACYELYGTVKDENIDILINNAGFGLFGAFDKTDLDTELNMLDTNVRAVHILTKLFLRDFTVRGSGYILNVASSAAFSPGPLMAVYYATKAYVLRLTQAISCELKKQDSRVYVGALCPGPVDTNFNDRAQVHFAVHSLKSADVARYAVKKMFAKKKVIVPGVLMKLTKFSTRLVPDGLALDVAYHIQQRKRP